MRYFIAPKALRVEHRNLKVLYFRLQYLLHSKTMRKYTSASAKFPIFKYFISKSSPVSWISAPTNVLSAHWPESQFRLDVM